MVGMVGGRALGGRLVGHRRRLFGLGLGEAVAKRRDALLETLDCGLRGRAPSARLLGLFGGPAQLPRAAGGGIVVERLLPRGQAGLLAAELLQRLVCPRQLSLGTGVLLVGV